MTKMLNLSGDAKGFLQRASFRKEDLPDLKIE
jgi:hypothetical protein